MATERSVMVRLRANADQFNREMLKARAAVSGVRSEIDQTNDRTAWLAQGFLALAPSLVPLGAAAVPILAGIATQATVAVGAIGTLALAFNGVGDGLKALNDYQLEPTAENFEKLQLAMEKLGPDGAEFVRFLDEAGSQLAVLQMDARAGMFPGMTEGIEDALRLLPRLRTVVSEISQGIGTLSADAGAGIAGPEFREFFDYLSTDAKDLLVDMGRTLGNFVDGFASMIVAFGPLTSEFSDGLLGMSRSFEEWAEGLESSQSFQEFVDYVRQAGPQALDLFGALVDAFVQLVQAAAPIGSVALPVLTSFFEVIAKIADTPVGSLLILTAALTSMYGRLAALKTITTGGVIGTLTQGVRESTTAAKTSIPTFRQFGLTLGYAAHSNELLKKSMLSGSKVASDSARNAYLARQAVGDFARSAAPAAAAGGLLALSMTGVADNAGLGNAAMGAMVGLMTTGGPWGLAIGGAIGATTDLAASFSNMQSNIEAANAAARSGDIEAMTATFNRLNKEIEQIGVGEAILGNTLGNLPALWGDDTWIEKTEAEANAVFELRSEIQYLKTLSGSGWDASGMAIFYEGLGFTADEAERAARGVAEFSAQVERALGILDQQAAMDAFQAAIDDASKSFKEFGATLDANTNAGRQNRAALREIASTALQAADGLRGIERVNFLQNASKQFVDMAVKLGMGEKAARRFADRLFDLGDINATPKVDMDDTEGRRKVMRMLREMDLLDGTNASPAVNLLIQQFLKGKVSVEQMMRLLNGLRSNPSVELHGAEAATSAARGLVAAIGDIQSKTVTITSNFVRHGQAVPTVATGGYIRGPGTTTSDSIPAMLSDREYVIRAAAVDHYGVGFFHRANAMQLAGGGQATRDARGLPPIYTRSSTDDVGREAAETARGLKWLRRELKEATKALEKERKFRDSLVQKMSEVSSTVSGGLRSDLFGDDNVWSGGSSPGGVMATLRGDISDARAMKAAIRELKKKGLSGAALSEVLAQGGLASAQAFAELSRVELREYAQLYSRRNRELRATGELAGGAAYGAMLRESRQEYRELKQEVVRLRHAVERNGKNDREDHRQNRESQRRGASNAARNRRHDR